MARCIRGSREMADKTPYHFNDCLKHRNCDICIQDALCVHNNNRRMKSSAYSTTYRMYRYHLVELGVNTQYSYRSPS